MCNESKISDTEALRERNLSGEECLVSQITPLSSASYSILMPAYKRAGCSLWDFGGDKCRSPDYWMMCFVHL